MTALMGGHTDSGFCAGVGGISESSLIRTLAVGLEKRLEDLPDIPTVSELGYPAKYFQLFTFAFPKGTPKGIVQKFVVSQKKALEKYSQEIKSGLMNVQMYPAFLSQNETVREFENKYNEIRNIIKEIGPPGKKE